MIRKIHSLLSLLLCLLLLAHLVVTGLLMSRSMRMHLGFLLLGYVLLFVLIGHVVFTFACLLLNRNQKADHFPAELTVRCRIQRITGVLIIVLNHPHMGAFSEPNTPAAQAHWSQKLAAAFAQPGLIMQPAVPVTMINLFYLVGLFALAIFCCLHVSLSIPKALVGLGMSAEGKAIARVEVICTILTYAAGIFAIWGAFRLAYFSGLFGGVV